VSKAVSFYSTYDWRDDVEGNLIEYLSVCWLRERIAILEHSELKQPFFALLASVVSRAVMRQSLFEIGLRIDRRLSSCSCRSVYRERPMIALMLRSRRHLYLSVHK